MDLEKVLSKLRKMPGYVENAQHIRSIVDRSEARDSLALRALADEIMKSRTKDGFDPDEPRDDHGRWSGGGSSADKEWYSKLTQGEILNLKPNEVARAWTINPERMANRFLSFWTSEERMSAASRKLANSHLPLTVNNGPLSHLHPGEVTVYRRANSDSVGAQPVSWSTNQKTTEGYGRNLFTMKVTKDMPALDLDKIGRGVRYDEIIAKGHNVERIS